jgi:hypothetical protein
MGEREERPPEGRLGRRAPVRGNGERNFHGERRRNDTRRDSDARLFRKGPSKQARFCFMGNVLMENRNRLATPNGWPR